MTRLNPGITMIRAINPAKKPAKKTSRPVHDPSDDVLRKMQHVLDLITLGRSLSEILARLVALVEQGNPNLLATVLIWQDDHLEYAAPLHLRPALRDALVGPAAKLLEKGGKASGRNAHPLIHDLATDRLWSEVRRQTQAAGLRTCCSVPLVAGDGAILGLFQVYCRRDERLPRAELRMLTTAGRLAALAFERKRMAELLVYQTQHDALTRLPNRSQLAHRLRQEIARVRRHGRPAAVLFIDMDRFTLVNETLGHSHGDQLLQEVALRLQQTMRETDTLVRMGGDVFVLIVSELAEGRDVIRVANRVLDSVKEPFSIAGREVFVTMSIGVAVYPDAGADEISLPKNAEAAMHHAKTQGGNRFHCYSPELNASTHDRLAIECDLRRAIRAGELLLHYQPQYDRDRRLIGLEALVRWNHPRQGMIPPIQFIPVAEASGLIIPLGAWVVREACRQNAAWQAAGHPPVKIAVNVSAMQFMQDDFVRIITRTLKQTGLAPHWLELELTESMLMHSGPDVAAKLQRLRDLGVSVALDDFGTGYASMTYLQKLPIDTLKIDRSFVNGIGASGKANDGVIIKAITSLAMSLGMSVVAEGVETEQQRQFLLHVGCSAMQGYLYSPPLSSDRLEAMLRLPVPDQAKAAVLSA